MNIDDLKKKALHALAFGVEQIKKDGELHMMFELVKRDGSVELMLIDGAITNDEAAKQQLGRDLKARVAAGDVEAVIMISDTYIAENLTPEVNKIRATLGLTLKQAADAGLCSVHEAVSMTLESPILTMAGHQEYRRGDNGVELVGEPKIINDGDGTGRVLPGRLNGYWPRADAGGKEARPS